MRLEGAQGGHTEDDGETVMGEPRRPLASSLSERATKGFEKRRNML